MKKLYTLVLVLFPLLSVYATPIPSISLGELILILICFLIFIDMCFNKNKSIRIIYPLFLFCSYIIIQYCFSAFLHSNQYMSGVLMRTIHLLFYYFVVCFLAKNYFDFKSGIKYLRNISILCSIYIYIQVIGMKIFNFYIPGVVTWLPLMRTTLSDYGDNYTGQSTFRPYSLFNEPAEYSTYVVLYLLIGLLMKKKSFREFIPELIISVGLFLSGSSTGIIMCVGIWGFTTSIRLIKTNKIKKSTLIRIIASTPIFLVLFILVLQSEQYFNFINRTFSSDGGLGGAALGRFSGYEVLIKLLNEKSYYWIIGRSMNRQYTDGAHIYIPGMGSLLNYFGIMGCLIFLYNGLSMYRSKVNILIFILMIIVGIGSDATFSVFSMLYFIFIFLKNPDNDFILS